MSLRTFADVTRPLHEDADFVVVGSGAAGATAAFALTEEGHDVILVEEGPPVSKEDFGDAIYPALSTLYRDNGMSTIMGRSLIFSLQGRVVGGTTVVNSAIAWRLPEKAYDRWAADPAIRDAFPLDELHRHWDRLDTLMHVSPTDLEIAGRANTLAAQGAERLGWSGKVMNRFTADCRGSGRCQVGCPHDAKMSTALTLIPRAERMRMRVLAGCLVQNVILDDSATALGIRGRMRDAVRRKRGPRVELRARKGVLLAPGCLQLPGLLAASGYKHQQLGKHFQAHPGSGIVPLFDDEVAYWDAATQGWESEQFVDEGLKLEVVNVPPEVNSGRFPGVGRVLAGHIRDLRHAGSWGVLARMDARGRVAGRPGLPARIRFTPTTEDMMKLRKGLYSFARIAFAAGARGVITGIYGLPPVLAPDDIDLLADAPLDPRRYTMVATHLFGTARAAGAEREGVCDPQLQPWGTHNLWVVDSSVFPRNLGVNPQHMIQAVAMHAAEKIAADS